MDISGHNPKKSASVANNIPTPAPHGLFFLPTNASIPKDDLGIFCKTESKDINPIKFWSHPSKASDTNSVGVHWKNINLAESSLNLFSDVMEKGPKQNSTSTCKADQQAKSSVCANELLEEDTKKTPEFIFNLDQPHQTYEFPSLSSKSLIHVLHHHVDESNSFIFPANKTILEGSASRDLSQMNLEHGNHSEQESQAEVNSVIKTDASKSTGFEQNKSQVREGYKSLFGQDSGLIEKVNCFLQDPISESNTSLQEASENFSLSLGKDKDFQAINMEYCESAEILHKLVVIDCRYHFEYKGGHIKSAINIGSPAVLSALFSQFRLYLGVSAFIDGLLQLEGKDVNLEDLMSIKLSTDKFVKEGSLNLIQDRNTSIPKDRLESLSDKGSKIGFGLSVGTGSPFLKNAKPNCVPVFVFHCEFSSKRAPSMWRIARNIDRQVNLQEYPRLDFPQMYILKDGYEKFVQECGQICEPQFGYVPMLSQLHKEELRSAEKRRENELVTIKKSKTSVHPYYF